MSNQVLKSNAAEFVLIEVESCGKTSVHELKIDVRHCKCLNGGKCDSAGECICLDGFSGPLCELGSEACTRCYKGTCVKSTNDDHECVCDFGYTGEFCDERQDSCKGSPCYPGVQCFPLGPTNYVCGSCPSGMTGNGEHCSKIEPFVNQSINLCLNEVTNPCFDKSYCREIVVGHSGKKTVSCEACPPGFKGDGILCRKVDTGFDPCRGESNPCHPGSKCSLVNGIVTCGPCPKNMFGNGKVCHEALNVTKCKEPNPCFDGVECTEYLGQQKCGPCPEGMTGNGNSCVQDRCASDPCFPGAECYNFKDRYKCGSCPPGFTGNGIKCTRITDIPFDPCAKNPCYQGVNCIIIWKGDVPDFSCGLCPDGTYI